MARKGGTKPKVKRRYSDDDRASALAALAANGGNVRRTADEMGVPRGTLERWAEGTAHPEAAANAAPKKEALADSFEALIRRLVGLAADAALEVRSAEDLVKVLTAAGIAVDKMRLLRDQATSITGALSDGERAARLRALVEQFAREARGNGPRPDGAGPAVAAQGRQPPGAGVP